MADSPTQAGQPLTARGRQPLISVPFPEGDTWVVRYFTSETAANAATAPYNEMVVQALSEGCDQTEEEFHEMLDELDRIRHETPPTAVPEPFP